MQTRGPKAPSPEDLIETPRLLLISVTEAMLVAERKGRGLDQLLGAIVPNTWPPDYWDQKAVDYLYERLHRNPHLHAALARVDLVEAVAQRAPRAKQHALDRALRQPHAGADAIVGEALELAHDEDPVLRLG